MELGFTFTQFLNNGNVIGFTPGKGHEVDLDGNVIFQTQNVNSVHHHFNKTPRDTYFLISAVVEDQYCPTECNSNLPNEIPWQGDVFREIDKDGNEIWSWSTFDYFDLKLSKIPFFCPAAGSLASSLASVANSPRLSLSFLILSLC